MYPSQPADPVARPVALQRWETLTFVHWRYPPEVVAPLLPTALEVDTFDGSAWIGLVPFRMVGVRPRFLPSIPWLTTFPETNVRTYVRDREGGAGVWFFSLDITRLLGVAVARIAFRVPYVWSKMSIRRDGDSVRYLSRRRFGDRASSLVEVERGPVVAADELAGFLTNRWRAYTLDRRGRPIFAPVAHEPWPLRSATLLRVDAGVVVVAGLPAPGGVPLVHHADGVSARVGRPQRVAQR